MNVPKKQAWRVPEIEERIKEGCKLLGITAKPGDVIDLGFGLIQFRQKVGCAVRVVLVFKPDVSIEHKPWKGRGLEE